VILSMGQWIDYHGENKAGLNLSISMNNERYSMGYMVITNYSLKTIPPIDTVDLIVVIIPWAIW
jgi:hypothetical protein